MPSPPTLPVPAAFVGDVVPSPFAGSVCWRDPSDVTWKRVGYPAGGKEAAAAACLPKSNAVSVRLDESEKCELGFDEKEKNHSEGRR